MSNIEAFNQDYLSLLERALKQYRQFSQLEMSKRGFNVSNDQSLLLQTILINSGTSQNEIAKKTGKDPASVTRMLDSLEKETLIERLPDKEDRRSFSIVLTQKGENFAKELVPLLNELRAFGIREINEKHQVIFIDVIKKIISNFS